MITHMRIILNLCKNPNENANLEQNKKLVLDLRSEMLNF